MDFKTLVIEKKGHIATLVFNRPEALNAIDATMFMELPAAIGHLNDDNNIFYSKAAELKRRDCF